MISLRIFLISVLISFQVGIACAIESSSNKRVFSANCDDWGKYEKSLPASAEDSDLPEKFDQLIVSKSQRILIAFSERKAVKKYPVSIGQNPIGAKSREGDLKTPEGSYFIQNKNSKSKYHLSLLISYPAEKDLKKAEMMQVPPGDSIMLHGFPLEDRERDFAIERHSTSRDWTQGCVAVEDHEIEEIFVRVKVQTPILICP